MQKEKKESPSSTEKEALTNKIIQESITHSDSIEISDSQMKSSCLECQESQSSFSKYSNVRLIGTANLTIPGNIREESKSYHEAL